MSDSLNSNIKRSEFKRKHLNLMVVSDISGSMGAPFSDEHDGGKTKMKVSNESVVALLQHLTDKDRFGMVPLDRTALETSILALSQRGGTNFEVGYAAAVQAFEASTVSIESADYDNRIIFLTDARPNAGSDEKSLSVWISPPI